MLTYTIDILLIFFSIYFSFIIKFGVNIPEYNLKAFTNIFPLIMISYIVFMFVFGLDNILEKNIGEIIYSIFLIVICLLVTISFIAFFMRQFAYPRTIILISSIIQFLTISVWRYVVLIIDRKKHGIKDSLVIGDLSAQDLAKKIIIKQNYLYRIKYICTDESRNIEEYINKVDVVFIASDVSYSIRSKIVSKCISHGKSVFLIPNSYELMLLKSKLHKADDTPLLNVSPLGFTVEQRVMKRLVDISVSTLGLLVTGPIMVIIAIIIKFNDGGNIFYAQERLTIGKRKFKVLKFRTMVMNAESLTGPVLAEQHDRRITKIGRILRATRMDELPQLVNILKGDMSVVGPRPERPSFVEEFERKIDDYKYRTIIKAGLTGFAQIYGKYNTTPEDKAKYDLMYIKNYSILLDLKLILLTVKIIFMKNSTEGIKDNIEISDFIKEKGLEIVVDRERSV